MLQYSSAMATTADFKNISLSFAGTTEVPHFDRQAFRTKRKIFATMLEKDGLGVALLQPKDQYIFCKMDEKNIYPVPNKWGLAGATFLVLKQLKKTILKEILLTAYNNAL